jgi:hypothetical protein
MKTYYELLEVQPNASLSEITKSYFRLAAKCHPDLVQRLDEDIQKLANEKMRELNLAYQVLKNETERARYDLKIKRIERRQDVEEQPEPPPSPPPTPPEEVKNYYPWDLVKEAAQERVTEIMGRSTPVLKPSEGYIPPSFQIFEGKKGLTHFMVFVRIEETITPAVFKQALSETAHPRKGGLTWNPLQKTFALVFLMGWGFHDLALLKKNVQSHNQMLLNEKGPQKEWPPFVVLFDFTTEQIFAPDLNPKGAPLLTLLKSFSFKGR